MYNYFPTKRIILKYFTIKRKDCSGNPEQSSLLMVNSSVVPVTAEVPEAGSCPA